jgi:DNA-binding transcriptional regulator YhcF (GntR family)
MDTPAWVSLDCVARCVYVELARRYAGAGSNNGRIPLSLRELAEKLGVSKATAMRALKKLQNRGFVVLSKQGAFSMKVRHATEWRLTEFRCDVTGNMATKDFQRWRENQNTVSRENPIGFRDETD